MARTLATIDSLTKLFDESSRPIYVVDAQRRIVYCNPALAMWMDLAPKRIVGRRVEYHSEASATDAGAREAAAPLTDLCPPPQALSGEPRVGTISCLARGGRMLHRTAEFVPLGRALSEKANKPRDPQSAPRYAVLVLLAGGDLSPQEVATELSGEPTSDELHRTIRRFRRAQAGRYSIHSLLGKSSAMQKVRAQVEAAAASGANTLISGRRGCGRAQVAMAIHYRAVGDKEAILVPVDCELLTDDLFERTLERLRAQHAAAEQRPTLLLENLDCMPAAHQSLLLAAIRRNAIDSLIIATIDWGSSRDADTDESVVDDSTETDGQADGTPTRHPAEPAAGCPVPATIDPPLINAVSTIAIRIPRLADRPEDLPILAQFFLETCNRNSSKQVGSLRSDALDLLALYSWPGELDQLRETMDAAHAACATHEITPADLPPIFYQAYRAAAHVRRQPERIVLDELLMSIEKEALVRALAQTGGNKSEAATLLGMTRPRLYRRLVQLGLAGEGSDDRGQPETPEFIESDSTE